MRSPNFCQGNQLYNYDHVFKTEIRRDGTEGSAQRSAGNKQTKHKIKLKLKTIIKKIKKIQAKSKKKTDKTFTISTGRKTRAKRQREDATRMMRATSQVSV